MTSILTLNACLYQEATWIHSFNGVIMKELREYALPQRIVARIIVNAAAPMLTSPVSVFDLILILILMIILILILMIVEET